MFLSSLLQFLVFVTLQRACLSKPTTRSITGTFSTSPPAATRSSTEVRGGGEGTNGDFTTTTPVGGKKIRTNKMEDTTSTSWVTGPSTSENGVVPGVTSSPNFNQQVNRPYCIINGQFYYAGPQKIYFGCFFVCECLGYGEFACSPLCKPENKPCPSNRWMKERRGCCDEYICLG